MLVQIAKPLHGSIYRQGWLELLVLGLRHMSYTIFYFSFAWDLTPPKNENQYKQITIHKPLS